MKSKNKNSEFKAVEFMREQRDRLTKLYQSDKEKFYKELEQSREKFLRKRGRKSRTKGMKEISNKVKS